MSDRATTGIMRHLDRIAPDRGDAVSLAGIMDELEDLAYPILMLLTAALNAVPGIPGSTGYAGIPLTILSTRRALGFKKALPDFLRRRTIEFSRVQSLRDRIRPWIRKAEERVRPRWGWMMSPFTLKILDWYIVILSLFVLIPVPLTAVLPGTGICLIAMGRLACDGAFIVFGIVLGMIGIGIFVGIIGGLAAALTFPFRALGL